MDMDRSYSPPPPSMPPPSLPLPQIPPRSLKSFQQNDHYVENEDPDEEISQQMTASYSEISFKSGLSPDSDSGSVDSIPFVEQILQRPVTLSCEKTKDLPLNSVGTVHVEGNMTHFVAEDLEYKLKLSSPISRKGENSSISSSSRSGTPSSLFRQVVAPQVGQLDVALLNDLECEAHRMATSIDSLTENLCGLLHSISSITADNVDLYKNSVSKMSESMDANIKSMYTMMAKAEEVGQSMKGVQSLSMRIKEIRRLVDLFESI